jgi:hypothetical protein
MNLTTTETTTSGEEKKTYQDILDFIEKCPGMFKNTPTLKVTRAFLPTSLYQALLKALKKERRGLNEVSFRDIRIMKNTYIPDNTIVLANRYGIVKVVLFDENKDLKKHQKKKDLDK